jgi:4-hydroxybenzoate polyprenyltransferase
MLGRIRQFLELIRFSHTVFALPFALLAALMAWRANWDQTKSWNAILDLDQPAIRDQPKQFAYAAGHEWVQMIEKGPVPYFVSWRWRDLLGILFSMVAGRSAAMAFNRLADREIDAANPRTAARHLPAGKLKVGDVRLFAVTSSVLFILSTLIFLPNPLPLLLSIPTLVFLLGYSYAKRFTCLSHFWLGTALGLAPVFSWIAIRGEIVAERPIDVIPALILGGAVMLWVAGFDIIYACQDAEFDRAQGLHSLPAKIGVAPALKVAAACHMAMVALLALVSLEYPYFNWIWWVGVAAIAVLLAYEHWIVRPDDLARVNTAFFNVNAVVSVGLLAVGALAIWT